MKKVLIVDDEEDILVLLKSFFRHQGYIVKVSKTCSEGLEIFFSFQPDIVLLDVNVGSADGREMCRQIKTHADYQHIPVILVSANNENLKNFTSHGANAAVEKPFDLQKLLAVVENNLIA